MYGACTAWCNETAKPQCSAKYKCTALCTWGLKMPSGIGPLTEHRLRLLKQAMDPGSVQQSPPTESTDRLKTFML
eukprot:s327_g36.t1